MSTDPFATLGLSSGATDEEIRAKYLQLVRENPPDRAPERFAEIRAAYEDLRDPARHLADQIFQLDCRASVADLKAAVRERLGSPQLTLDALLALADPS